MTLFRRRSTLITALSVGGALLLSTAWAASKYVTLCFEAEKFTAQSGKTFVTKKYTEDASGKVSGGWVLALPKLPPGEKLVPDAVTYKVRVPQSGTYFLWARTYWATGCGNSFSVKVEGYDSGEWVIGGDGTYDSLHWVCLTDGGDNSSRPRPLSLKKGDVTLTLGAKESGARVDQFLLTTDRGKTPAGVYKPTPDVVVNEKK
jgi:hypothetical protein